MECLWRLFRYRQQDGHCDRQNPSVFYVYLYPYDGVTHHHLYGTGILEKYAALYLGSQTKPLVLFITRQILFQVKPVDKITVTPLWVRSVE